MRYWLRRWIRRNTNPIPAEKAMKIRRRIAGVYALFGWNMFGLIIYLMVKDKFPKTSSPAEYAKLLGVNNAKVLRYDGIQKMNEYDVEVDLDDSYHVVDVFSEMLGEDIKYYKYIDEEEEVKK